MTFPLIEPDDLVSAFLRPPLYRSLVESTWGTVYTAAYAPMLGAMTLLWPDDQWALSVPGDEVGITAAAGARAAPRGRRADVPGAPSARRLRRDLGNVQPRKRLQCGRVHVVARVVEPTDIGPQRRERVPSRPGRRAGARHEPDDGARGRSRSRSTRAQGPVGHLPLLPRADRAHLLRLADGLQHPRHRRLGERASVRLLLRLLRRCARPRVRPDPRRAARVRDLRVGQHLPARAQGGRRPDPQRRPHDGGGVQRRGSRLRAVRHVRRGDGAAGRRAGPDHRAAPARAARADRLQDRDDAAGQRGRRRERSQRPDPRRLLRRSCSSAQPRPDSATGSSSSCPTATPGAPRSSSPARRSGTTAPSTSSART